ncbi:MAG: cyclic nucleotide-binding domain-containing protein [Candidatus Competibacterales bacterium]|nr:cyclic nucleotide-binding domain-containing protein [Candidatus Competibacterales bacterium]
MKPVGIDQLLAEHPFFRDLTPEYRDLIAGCATNVRFQAGDFVFREGEPADRFYLLRHGSVALEIHLPRRDALVIDTLHAGDILGWSWLLEPYTWHLDARAVQLVRAISLDAACLRGKMESDHELGYALYRRFLPVIARRMQAGRLQLIDMYGQET